MTAYRVAVEPVEQGWVLQAIEAPGAISQVPDLRDADRIREAIAFVTGEAESDIYYTLVDATGRPLPLT